MPIAVGEQFGYKWDINTLIEKQLIDYARVTLPNVGGISEFMKIVAIAETHYVGMIPHFTGPIAEAALVHCLTATLDHRPDGDARRRQPDLSAICRRSMTSRTARCGRTTGPGSAWRSTSTKLTMLGEYDTYRAGMLMNHRPDGSFTNW